MDGKCTMGNCSKIIYNFKGTEGAHTSPYTWDVTFRDSTRFWVQYVVVPVVFIVGLAGNIVTIFILTRKSMRSSSNTYLTALAFSDMMFLIFSFTMSWKHYQFMEGVWLYWKYIPIGLWITDASCSTSVWLTVAFTTERYIAVCYPMMRKAYCTEQRAKYATVIVYIACFILTASTAFEWKSVAKLVPQLIAKTSGNTTEIINETNIFHTAYVLKTTELGESTLYRFFYNWMTILVFVIIPFCALSILNLLLVAAVKKSRAVRESMTPSHLQNQIRSQIMRQEDRITVTLIAVVIMFLVCQMPTAAVLIYTAMNTPPNHGSLEENIQLGLGNIFNLLVLINAACNFLLYTVLCDKYRKIFVNIILLNCFFLKQYDSRRIWMQNRPREPRAPCSQNGSNNIPEGGCRSIHSSTDDGPLEKPEAEADKLDTKMKIQKCSLSMDETRNGLPVRLSGKSVGREALSV